MQKLSFLLQNASKEQIESEISSRFAKNLEFFSTQNQKLYKELITPAKTYNLFFDDRGINIINLEEKSFEAF